MRTKNAMQLKAHVNNMAKKAGIPAQALMQSYLLERLLERLSKSAWKDNVVIKGGVYVSANAAAAEGEDAAAEEAPAEGEASDEAEAPAEGAEG